MVSEGQRRVVLDSSAWVEYFRGTSTGAHVRELVEGGQALTPTLVVAELADLYARERWGWWSRDFEFVRLASALIPLSAEIAAEAGDAKRRLRRRHPGASLADAIIYLTARDAEATLVTLDQHFEGLEGVRLLRPTGSSPP